MQEFFDNQGHFFNIVRFEDFFFAHKVGLTYSHLYVNELFQHFNNEIIVEYLAVFFLLHLISFSNTTQGFSKVLQLQHRGVVALNCIAVLSDFIRLLK